MVVCTFFLQGTCRFGNSCRFEHQINPDHSYTGSTSILLQNYNANKPPPQQQTVGGPVDTNTLIRSVHNDMISTEKGGQWLLSSYSPFKDKPPFPGFEDHSMEEVRYMFYEAVKNGTVDQFKHNLQLQLQQTAMKIKALQSPSPDQVNILKQIYNTAPNSSGSGGIFGGQASSMFPPPQPQQHTPIFSAAPAQPKPSIFGGQQQSVFGGTPQTGNSIFGGPQPNGSIFNAVPSVQPQASPNPNSSPLFGSLAPNASIFGPGAAQQPAFGGQPASSGSFPQQVAQSPFGTSQPAQPSQSPFGASQPAQPSQSPFGAASQPIQSPFSAAPAQPQQVQSPFASPTAQPSNPSPFGAALATAHPANQSPFGAISTASQPVSVLQQQLNSNVTPPTGNQAHQHSSNIFGAPQVGGAGGVFGGGSASAQPNMEIYSKIEDLSEEDIKWFTSDDMDLSKIPEKPPTYEMCFK